MTIDEVIRRIEEVGIIPVVRAASVEEATRAVEAICAGGIPVVEITMTVPNAVSVIREVAKQHGATTLIGAGTVTTARTGRIVHSCRSGVPGEPRLVAHVLSVARAAGKLAIPGALTPTELMNAHEHGARLVKIFPCGNVGGPKYLSLAQGAVPEG